MKTHAVALFLLLLCATLAMADDWAQTFRDTFYAKGVDEAVVNALSEGVPPDQLIQTALPLKELKPEELIKAMYCALVPPAYIQDAAAANDVTDEIVQKGYELALAQCAEEMEEKATAAPAFLPGKDSSPGGRTGTASPSNFE
ncbi:MAG: hypothetical protein ACYC9M_07875 [Desulfobulbaceae bacterium]